MRFSAIVAAGLLACLTLPGCSEELPPPEPDRPTIDETTFTRALADLVVARIEILPDTAAYAIRAEEILRGHGITAEEFRTFVEVHGQNDDVMTRAYARVEARLDSLYPTAQAGVIPEAEGVLPGASLEPDSVVPAP
ncbi:MAG TPA: hypothetical protein VIE68_07010 [Gemmatimonadota bacterium]|jgi:hypothetical protein